MPASGLPLTPPWLLATVGSALLHAWAVGSVLQSAPTPRLTAPAMAVRWLPATDTPTSGAVGRPTDVTANAKGSAASVAPKRTHRAPATQRASFHPLRTAAEPPTPMAMGTKALTTPPLTAAPPPSPPPPPPEAPPTADLFGPLTTQPLGHGGWGRRRRAAANTEAQAAQAQQPWVLQASMQSRLTAMAEVVRQGQPTFECEIRVDTFTRQAQVRCDPPVLHSAAWQALQGLALPGDATARTETTECLQWSANRVLWAPCPPEVADRPGDITPAATAATP